MTPGGPATPTPTTAVSGRLLGPAGDAQRGTILLDPATGLIVGVTGASDGEFPGGVGTTPPAGGDGARRLVDVGERLLAPGYVDVHVHGGAGAQVNGDSQDEVEEAVATIAGFHALHGTTSLVATTVSDSPGRLAASVRGVARAARAGAGSRAAARVLGCHLEGPFVAPGRSGAQDPSRVRPPDRNELNRLLELGEGTIRMVTLAPELPGADELIADCLAAGAVVALGHTDVDYDGARRAFDAGASHVTHLWNAMPPLRHRAPGLPAAALLHERVTVEIVCDLHHVHPAVVALTAQAAPGRVALVTDAISAAGAGPGRYRLGNAPVDVAGTVATLADRAGAGVLAGSVLTMGQAVRNAVDEVGLPPAQVLAAASAVPVRALGAGAPSGAGILAAGAPADVVVLEPTLSVAATLVGGKVVHDPGGLFAGRRG